MTAALTSSRPDPAAAREAADPDLRHLKRLLLTDERRDLDALRADVLRLDRRVGSEDRFCRAVADSLVLAIKAAEIESHRDLAAVLAPLVISGIRREIAESRDEMVETLYPITGRMVAAAVTAMFRELSDDVNRKIREALSVRWWRLRLNAIVTRRPLSELILEEIGRGRLERILLIERGTGAILAATDADGRPEPEPDTALNLVGGLVTAIVEFAGQALSGMHGELRQLDFGGQTVLLRASPLLIAVAITGPGTVAPNLPAVEDAFLAFVDEMHAGDQDGSGQALTRLHRTIASHLRPEWPQAGPISPLKIIAGILAAACLVGGLQSWRAAQERASAAATLAGIERLPELAPYPVQLALDPGTGMIRASGVVPDAATSDRLRHELAQAFPSRPIEMKVAALSETPQARQMGEALRGAQAQIASLEAALAAEREASALRQDGVAGDLAGLRSRAATAEERLNDLGTATAERAARDAAALRQEIAALDGRLDTPRARLDALVRGTAVFFQTASAEYRDAEAAERDLAALARAMLSSEGARLRVIGYGDGSGTSRANLDAARKRAERIAAELARLGIEPSRLTLVTTRLPHPIADGLTAGPNRRAVFELVYAGE